MTLPFRTTLAVERLGDRLAPAAGGLDPTFGAGGRVAQAVDFPDQPAIVAGAVAVQPDGRIVLAGYPFGAARLNPDGSPDPTFGSGGVAAPAPPPHVYEGQLTAAAVAVNCPS
jgi:hypothetical protein